MRLRGTIHQTNTETGRLAMEEPNLQTLRAPARDSRARRRRLDAPLEPVRRPVEPSGHSQAAAFRAPAAREVLLSADYKQLELRVAAHFSKDEALLAAFANERHDPFDALASRCAAASPATPPRAE